jgi:hypothetical protein
MRSCELAALFKPLDLISEIICNLLRGEGSLLEDGGCGGGCGGLLGGAVGVVEGHAAPPLLWARWGVKRIKIQASLESHTSHFLRMRVLLVFLVLYSLDLLQI